MGVEQSLDEELMLTMEGDGLASRLEVDGCCASELLDAEDGDGGGRRAPENERVKAWPTWKGGTHGKRKTP